MKLIAKKTLTTFLLFFCFWVIDSCSGYLLEKTILSSNVRFSKLYKGTINTKILILGSSRGVSLYAPDIQTQTGLTTFNLSYNGMSMVIARDLFYDFLKKNDPPSILALEISNLHRNDSLINNLKLYKDQSQRISNLLRTENYSTFIATNVSNLYKYNSEFFLRSLYYLNKTDQTWANRYTINPDIIDKMKIKTKLTNYGFTSIRPESLVALDDILKLADKQNIEVRLLVSPYLPFIVENNTDYKNWKAQIQACVSESPIWDYSASISKLEYFADDKHLNVKGSKHLTSMMINDGFFAIDSMSSLPQQKSSIPK